MAVIEPTKKQEQLIEAAISGKYRVIIFGGAVGGAKTAGLYITFLIAQRIWEGIRVYFIRKDLSTIISNSYATWDEITGKYGVPSTLKRDRRSNPNDPSLDFTNGSRLIFFGENYDKDKELNRWKGLIPNWIFADEINELQYKSYLKMFERAGRFQVPRGKNPHPLIIGTCNPTQNWVKTEIYDKWKNNILPDHILYIPSKITDNPHLPQAYVDNLKNLPRYEYEVYVEGNWDIQVKTGSEFLKDFDIEKHINALFYSRESSIHVSFDNNVYPYISISIWQLNDKSAKQIHELPVKDPHNTATKAAQQLVKYLSSIDYDDTVFIYGDQTSANRNTIDDNKKSFIDKFTDEIKRHYSVRKKIPSSNPPVAISGDFVNAILSDEYLGISIEINETCKESISDYINTKQDREGGVLKKRITDKETGISYEPYGHFVDNMRYFICECFKYEFRKFRRRFKDDGDISVGSPITDRRF